MSYLLSVDLGTTFSAAAIIDDAGPKVVSLGSRTATIPSVVALRPDGTVLIGEAAERRAVSDPTRVAREFKRRLGDPVSTIIGGTPYGAETLMAHLLRGIVGQVAEQQGGRPDRIVLSHPANYGPYKLDLLEQVGHLAELEETEFITEPQAAAVHYSEGERIEPGEVVAVYDLGGGTFDAALVLSTDDGFKLLGTPDGMERFGGIDLDEAVFMHVRRSLGGAIDALDPADSAVVSALARLREDCRLAKEGLSSDTDAAIPIMLPNLHTEVRLVRTEFEDMIRPRLRETMATLERVVRSAGLEFGDLSRVLLVGGSSRIPLVGEMVRQATGRSVSLDAHPKHAIVLGAASAGMAGATRRAARAGTASRVAPGVPPAPQPPAEAPAESMAALTSASPPEIDPLPVSSEERGLVEGRGPRMPHRRRLVAGLAGLCAAATAIILAIVLLPGGGSGEAPVGLPPVEGAAPASNVLAIYVTDFRLPGDGDDWGGWSRGGNGTPPGDIASDFYPALGPYDVRDPAIVAQHFALMRRAGIGTAAVNWAGVDSPGNAAMPGVLEMAERYGLSFALILPFPEHSAQEFFEMAEEAHQLYGGQSAWLRASGLAPGEPRPVILLRAPHRLQVDLAAWMPVLESLDFMVVVESADSAWIEAGAGGLMLGKGGDGYNWASRLPDGALYVPIVSPGFSEKWVGGPGDFADRRAGQSYREDWELAHAVRPPSLVVIDSFNSWTAGSQIEPAAQDPPERAGVPYSTYAPLEPEGYLQITREMIEP